MGNLVWVKMSTARLVADGVIGAPLAEALEAEYLLRAEAGTLYGFLPFFTMIARNAYALAMPPEMTHAQAQPDALAMAGLLHWMERAAPSDFRVCRSVAEIRTTMEAGIIAGVMHMEGAEAIGPDLDALHLFHDMACGRSARSGAGPRSSATGCRWPFPVRPTRAPASPRRAATSSASATTSAS